MRGPCWTLKASGLVARSILWHLPSTCMHYYVASRIQGTAWVNKLKGCPWLPNPYTYPLTSPKHKHDPNTYPIPEPIGAWIEPVRAKQPLRISIRPGGKITNRWMYGCIWGRVSKRNEPLGTVRYSSPRLCRCGEQQYRDKGLVSAVAQFTNCWLGWVEFSTRNKKDPTDIQSSQS